MHGDIDAILKGNSVDSWNGLDNNLDHVKRWMDLPFLNKFAIPLWIPEYVTESAIEQHLKTGCMNDRSFLKGLGNVVGFISEGLTPIIYPDLIKIDTYSADFVNRHNPKYTIDVKGKHCTTDKDPVANYHDASVAAYQILKKNARYYMFFRVMVKDKRDILNPKNFLRAWLCGIIRTNFFFKNAWECKEGEPDPNSENGFCYNEDCYSIPYQHLYPAPYRKSKIDWANRPQGYVD